MLTRNLLKGYINISSISIYLAEDSTDTINTFPEMKFFKKRLEVSRGVLSRCSADDGLRS